MSLFTLMFAVSLIVGHSASASYRLSLIKATNCLSDKNDMWYDIIYNASIPSSSKYNHFVVYKDITESMNITITCDLYKKETQWKLIPYASGKSVNYCTFLKYDIAMMPVIRKFAEVSQSCPIKKGKYLILNNEISSIFSLAVMPGCWKLNLKWYDSNRKYLTCITFVGFQSHDKNHEIDPATCY